MKCLGTALAIVMALGLAAGAAQADTVLDFEGLTSDDTVSFAGAGATNYGGLNWTGSWALVRESFFQNGTGHNNTATFASGDYGAFNVGALTVTAADSGLFDFHGAHFIGWGKNDDFEPETSTTITIEGYLGGSLVSTTGAIDIQADSMDWVAAGFAGIDEVRFSASGSMKFWIMDDFTHSPVPEPGTLALMGLGLAGAAALGRRRRRKAA